MPGGDAVQITNVPRADRVAADRGKGCFPPSVNAFPCGAPYAREVPPAQSTIGDLSADAESPSNYYN